MSGEIIKKNEKNKKIVNISIRNKCFDFIVVICLVIFSIAICPKDFQNDTFYTIKCGEYIFNNGIFNLNSDPFSWLDLPYCFPHWLYDLMIYIIYLKAGFDGIYISTIVFTFLLGIVLYNTTLYKSKNRVVSSVIVFLAIYLLKSYITARAQLVTFVLFALEILFIEKLLATKKYRYGIGLIIIAILIAQLHVAVFPMFFIFTLPYFGEFVIAYFFEHIFQNFTNNIQELLYTFLSVITKNESKKKKYSEKITKINQNKKIKSLKYKKLQENPYKVKVQKNKNIIILSIVVVIAGFSGFLNPTGDTAYTYLIKTYNGNTTQSINEHQPIVLVESEEFSIALIIFLLILTFMDLKIELSDLFMLVGVTIMAFFSRRQIAIFSIACCPILARLIADFFEKYDKQTCEKLLIKATSTIGFIIILGLFSYCGYESYKKIEDDQYIYNSDYPVKACDWILDNLDLSNLKLYNEYNYGSYLIFRGIPVFIDSRADLYSPEFNNVKGYKNAGDNIFDEALDVPSLSIGYEEIFEKYGVNHVMLYDNAKLALLLNEDSNYNLIYNDDDFKIYERLNANNEE